MLKLVDPDIISGLVKLYDWQTEFLQEFAKNSKRATTENPNLALMVANNGAGKDLWIIAPCVLWFICTNVQATVVITTSSGTQLTNQTEPAIRRISSHINDFLKSIGIGKRLVEKQRNIESEFTGSDVFMFATDDKGKAEGYHPKPGRRQFNVTNEGKSLSSDIYQSMKRGHGYTDWLDVSSSGEEIGEFYNNFLSPHFKLKRVIDVSMCPHISKSEYERNVEQYGFDHPFIQSSYWSKFVSQGAYILITDKMIRECMAADIPKRLIRKSIGVDIAAVCDETVITMYNGSKFVRSWHRDGFRNMTDQEEWLVTIFKQANPDTIRMDYDGIGRGTVDNLIRVHKFDNIIPVQFGTSAIRKDMFANCGAEKWSHAQRLIEKKLIEIDKSDDKLRTQLGTRRYSTAGGKTKLESKKEAKARGVKSPDRADSLVLALSGFEYDELSLSPVIATTTDFRSGVNGWMTYEEYERQKWKPKQNKRAWKNLWMS